MTDPPVIGDVALLVARRFGAPLVVVSQDVFPEIAVELERLENRVVVAALRVLDRRRTCAAPTASSRSARRCASGSSRRARARSASS